MTDPFANRKGLELDIEAAPENMTIHPHGQRFGIDIIDKDLSACNGRLSLITHTCLSELTVHPQCAAVLISEYYRVLQIVEPVDKKIIISLPPQGFVLIVDYKWFDQRLSELFHLGDTVKLRNQGELIVFQQLMNMISGNPYLQMNQPILFTEIQSATIISGSIVMTQNLHSIAVYINGSKISVKSNYEFSIEFELVNGINVFTIELYDGLEICETRELVVYRIQPVLEQKPVFLWVEQGHNFVQLSAPDAVRIMLEQAKKSGVTAIVVDVKGIEGFAAYKHNELTGRPYASSMQAPGRTGANPEIDLLFEFTKVGKEIGIEIHAAFNVFAEGSYYRGDHGLPELLDAGGQYILHPDDNRIMLQKDSKQVLNGKAKIAYVNPADDYIRDFELRTIEEVVRHYDIDGIVLDRCRYDDEHADFSEVTRVKFADFVEQQGKALVNWPEDIFIFQNGVRADGPLLKEWWEFRARTITAFVQEVRTIVNCYNTNLTRKKVQLSAYVGAWYEYAYRYGINWASKSFQYDQAFNWPEEDLYTLDYAEAAYIDVLDFIIIGTYQQNLREIEHYITLAHIVTKSDIPIISGIALPYIQESSSFPSILQTGLNKSSGVMLFDHCHIKWPLVENALVPC